MRGSGLLEVGSLKNENFRVLINEKTNSNFNLSNPNPNSKQ